MTVVLTANRVAYGVGGTTEPFSINLNLLKASNPNINMVIVCSNSVSLFFHKSQRPRLTVVCGLYVECLNWLQHNTCKNTT